MMFIALYAGAMLFYTVGFVAGVAAARCAQSPRKEEDL